VAGRLNLDPDDYTSSPSQLGANQWGAALTDTFVNADPSKDSVWFKIPDSTEPNTIKQTTAATANTGEVQALTIGAKVNYSLPANATGDEYQNTVVITAVANEYSPPAPSITYVDPNKGSVAGGTPIVILGYDLDTAYQVFIDLDDDGEQGAGEDCTNATFEVLGGNYVWILCYSPAVTDAQAGTYDIVVKTWGGTTKQTTPTATDDFTYLPIINPATCRNADPASACVVDLDPAMIPVKYTGTTANPTWEIADLTEPADWYDYEQKQWANAVTVKASGGTLSRADYQTAAAGTVVNPADILSYYVYIPRYRYQIWTTAWSATNFPKAVNLSFENCQSNGAICAAGDYDKATVAEVVAALPNAVGTWLTHPAFTFNDHELNGFWVGKFENTNSYQVPRALPDKPQVVNAQIALFFDNAKNATANNNEQGLSASVTDSRIFNNDDWGAVAYLSQSLYGVCTNMNCTISGNPINNTMSPAANEVQKVWNNAVNTNGSCTHANSSSGIGRTGYGANGKSDNCITTTSNANIWYSDNGQLASTNHNPTGVYDMAGGVWEYVLDNYNGVMNGSSGSSGFTSPTNPVYINTLTSGPLTNSVNDIFNGKYNLTSTFTMTLGQSNYEVGGSNASSGWNADYGNAVTSSYPWHARGGMNNVTTNAGIFAIAAYHGASHQDVGSRLLLSKY
jgi:hypothetical protein